MPVHDGGRAALFPAIAAVLVAPCAHKLLPVLVSHQMI